MCSLLAHPEMSLDYSNQRVDPLSLVFIKTALTETGLLLNHALHIQKAGEFLLLVLSLAAWFYSFPLQVLSP